MELKKQSIIELVDGNKYIVQQVHEIDGKKYGLVRDVQNLMLRFVFQEIKDNKLYVKFVIDKAEQLKIAKEFDKVNKREQKR